MTTCEDVRPLLPDHVLGSIEGRSETDISRHLRGCAACRREQDALREGLGVFASTLERRPPPELRDRVLEVLTDEWAEEGDAPATPRRGARRAWAVAVAASLAVALVAGAFAFVQMGRAHDALADATSYRAVLSTLGGTGFRVGSLEPVGNLPVEGSVVAYESSHDQSFVLLFIRVPGLRGEGRLLITRSDGTTWNPGSVDFDGDGDAADWYVTDRSIGSLTGLTVTAPDGSALAEARIRPA